MFVIAGVSGNTGSIVADALLAAGKQVRVIVRDAQKGEPWKKKGAEVAVASLDDAAALSTALAGAEAAYLLSPPDMGATDFLAQRRATVESYAKAIDAAKVPHVVFLSSIGAQHQTGVGIIASVAYAEERLAKTSAKLTFIRPGYFLENWASVLEAAKGGKLPTFVPVDLKYAMVGTKDIGRTAANALLESAPKDKTQVIELAGPRDYDARDIAAILGKILGREVVAEAAPTDAVVPVFTSFGISQNIADLFRQMYVGFLDGTVAFEGGKSRFVRGSTDAEAVLRGLLGLN